MKKLMIILAVFAICGSMTAQDCKHLYKEQKLLNKTTQKERMEKVGKDAQKDAKKHTNKVGVPCQANCRWQSSSIRPIACRWSFVNL